VKDLAAFLEISEHLATHYLIRAIQDQKVRCHWWRLEDDAWAFETLEWMAEWKSNNAVSDALWFERQTENGFLRDETTGFVYFVYTPEMVEHWKLCATGSEEAGQLPTEPPLVSKLTKDERDKLLAKVVAEFKARNGTLSIPNADKAVRDFFKPLHIPDDMLASARAKVGYRGRIGRPKKS
jgi:hypothetical protein